MRRRASSGAGKPPAAASRNWLDSASPERRPPSGDDGSHRCAQVPLPSGTRCYAVAASLGPSAGGLKARLLGDGLVPVASALGQHRDVDRRLDFAGDRQAVVRETGHLELLASAAVCDQLGRWLR